MKSTTWPADTRRQMRDNRHIARRWWTAAVLLLLISAGSLTLGLLGHQNRLPAPETAPQVAPPPAVADKMPPSAKQPVNLSVARARTVPVALRIPAIGVSVSLGTLGLNPDRTVQVPTNY